MGWGYARAPTTLTSAKGRTFRTPKTPANTRSPQEAGQYERIGDYLS